MWLGLTLYLDSRDSDPNDVEYALDAADVRRTRCGEETPSAGMKLPHGNEKRIPGKLRWVREVGFNRVGILVQGITAVGAIVDGCQQECSNNRILIVSP